MIDCKTRRKRVCSVRPVCWKEIRMHYAHILSFSDVYTVDRSDTLKDEKDIRYPFIRQACPLSECVITNHAVKRGKRSAHWSYDSYEGSKKIRAQTVDCNAAIYLNENYV
ncbi:hypothetical protein Tcan_00891, partial [Toxocara canis]